MVKLKVNVVLYSLQAGDDPALYAVILQIIMIITFY